MSNMQDIDAQPLVHQAKIKKRMRDFGLNVALIGLMVRTTLRARAQVAVQNVLKFSVRYKKRDRPVIFIHSPFAPSRPFRTGIRSLLTQHFAIGGDDDGVRAIA